MATPPAEFPLEKYLSEMQSRVEALLEERLAALVDQVPSRLLESMRYSLTAGGKRLRPILCLAFAQAAGGTSAGRPLEDAACALEWVHTYSLIHDDLPAMDDDDVRRGRPTNHKVFGEALAILAGDSLLTEAFSLLAAGSEPVRLGLVRELATAAGAAGMVGGQVLDIAPDRPAEESYLLRLHRLKTGALIRAACRMGVLCAGGTAEEVAAASTYGDAVGLVFQIADDLLDVTGDPALLGKPTGADEAASRFTFPRVVGMERSQSMAQDLVARAVAAVAGLGRAPGPLAALARYSLERSK